MADADWAKYKQLRGSLLPSIILFRGLPYQIKQLFKQDFYAVTGLFELQDLCSMDEQHPAQVVFKIYHTDPVGRIPLAWLGRFLCDREVFYYQLLAGIPGLPTILERVGESGFIREYIPGGHLRDYRKTARPNGDFYPHLQKQLQAIHERGISHNDLSKPENILVRPDGTPVLIDFQIACRFVVRFPIWKQISPYLLRYMQLVDRYHLRKHHRRDRPQDFSPDELALARKKGTLLQFHNWLLRKPYRTIRHFVLRNFMLRSS